MLTITWFIKKRAKTTFLNTGFAEYILEKFHKNTHITKRKKILVLTGAGCHLWRKSFLGSIQLDLYGYISMFCFYLS